MATALFADTPSSIEPRTSRSEHGLSEDLLVQLWAGQRFPANALATAAGGRLRVLHPGRRGRGPGPDFRDAVIAPPAGRLLRGDVELHVHERDFRVHGHQRDRAYDGLVLHVVFEHGGAHATRLAGGRSVPVVALGSWVRARARELEGWLAAPPLWREPCQSAPGRIGRDEILAVLERLGDERFAAREAALRAEIAARGEAAALYRALLEGLGYGGAGELMAAAAATLPWEGLEAALAGSPEGERAATAESLLLEAAGGELASLGRPANHPKRRLAGLARLLVRHRPLEGITVEGSELIRRWTVGAAAGDGAALIGRARAIELLTNAVLPWQAARRGLAGDAEGAAEARRAFARLPRPARYGALSFLEANLQEDGGALSLNARSQQGLLALYKSQCTQGGCGRCVFS